MQSGENPIIHASRDQLPSRPSRPSEPADAVLASNGHPLPPVLAPTNKSGRKKLAWSLVLRATALPVLIISVWQLLSALGSLNEQLFPPPSAIFTEFWTMLNSGELGEHMGVSIRRAALGFLLGGTLGLLTGLFVGLFRNVEQTLDPSLQMLRTIPHLAITPLFILWFGFGELSKILLIALGAFFPLYVNTFLGVRNVDAKLFDVSRVLEFSRWKQMTHLIIPSALPNVLLGIRLSIGISWLGLVVAELMGASEGIGYMIQDARQFSRTTAVFVGIAIFAVVGKLADSFVRMLERRFLQWRDSYQG